MIFHVSSIEMRADQCNLHNGFVYNPRFDRHVSKEELLLVSTMAELAQCKFHGYKHVIYSLDLDRALPKGPGSTASRPTMRIRKRRAQT